MPIGGILCPALSLLLLCARMFSCTICTMCCLCCAFTGHPMPYWVYFCHFANNFCDCNLQRWTSQWLSERQRVVIHIIDLTVRFFRYTSECKMTCTEKHPSTLNLLLAGASFLALCHKRGHSNCTEQLGTLPVMVVSVTVSISLSITTLNSLAVYFFKLTLYTQTHTDT